MGKRVLIVGATGTLGRAVARDFATRAEVIEVGHTHGSRQVDITDSASIRALFETVGNVDAIVSVTGKVHYGLVTETTAEQFRVGLNDKLLGQIELALVGQRFLNDGGSITPEDVRRARASNSEIAQQIAELQEQRAHPKAPIQVASLGPSLPQLLSPPKPVERQVPLGTRPTDRERAALAALADEPLPQLLSAPVQASRPRSPAVIATSGELKMASADAGARSALDRLKRAASLSRDTTFVPAPAYDEEHPEELSYRPFPIAPFLTTTSSADDPALARMVHPDLNKTLEMLDQAGSVPPMRLRPGSQAAQLMWAQQFKGEAVNFFMLTDPDRSARASSVNNRVVHTQAQ